MEKVEEIKSLILDSVNIKNSLAESEITLINVQTSIEIMVNSLSQGGKILVCGNGGSAAQAQHFAAEIVGRFEKERKSLPAISLTADTSNLTAISNDYGFENVFSKQVEALGNSRDVLIGISTSGNSENIIRAIVKAKSKGMKIISLLGRDGGKMKNLSDVDLIIDSKNTARIQESHILLLHIFAKFIEDFFLNKAEY